MAEQKQVEKQFASISFDIKSIDDTERSFYAVASTAAVDRAGESISQDGWDYSHFIKNPVIPWGHDYSQPPVAKAMEIGLMDGKLMIKPKFATADEYPFADTIYKLYKGGYLSAFSVGFIPKEYDPNSGKYAKMELLEVSAVTVPCNPEALALSVKEGIINDRERKMLVSSLEKQVVALGGTNQKDMEQTKQKGAVADEVAADQQRDDKYSQLEEFWDMVYAFCDVYLAEETDPSQFGPLVSELADLLKGLAGDATASKSLKVGKADKSVMAELFQKAGATLSADTKKKITDAMEAMMSAHGTLSDLMKSVDGEKTAGETATKDVSEEDEAAEAPEKAGESDEPSSDTNSEPLEVSEGASEGQTAEELTDEERGEIVRNAVRDAINRKKGRVA